MYFILWNTNSEEKVLWRSKIVTVKSKVSKANTMKNKCLGGALGV